ncbi:MAG TPA: YheV family putative metal-binding protein [Dehalococcoidia bacterium]|nr:YheV family putative metal-binding protein [Dehalococcoidia bacterium]
MWYKNCPKCGKGDLIQEKDIYGSYRQCVQCGYLEDLAAQEKPAEAPAKVTITK